MVRGKREGDKGRGRFKGKKGGAVEGPSKRVPKKEFSPSGKFLEKIRLLFVLFFWRLGKVPLNWDVFVFLGGGGASRSLAPSGGFHPRCEGGGPRDLS